MTLSLYSAVVPNYVQILGAVRRLLDKAEAHCAETGCDPADLHKARLADDMLPFGYQVKSCSAHSIGAIDGVRAGVFSPDMNPWPTTFDGLREAIDHALAAVEALDPDEINGFVGRDMKFTMGEMTMPFIAEDFLLSFSQPNFYFHATTAYDILRWKGVKLGKRDFMGRPRLKA
ncbi:DUF1993 domain-containing protein [Sphingomonas mali]|uniref:DUF1993 domain-containing protein n=1 Tax=Sphingomonas mali TaxID=40682 RepID=UPI00082E0A30|nr:DUF1993 domain-containing protein [Sphingomonas mali]